MALKSYFSLAKIKYDFKKIIINQILNFQGADKIMEYCKPALIIQFYKENFHLCFIKTKKKKKSL